MWCPKCKYRYLTKQRKCTNCGSKLIEEPKQLPTTGYRYLTTCRNEFDLQLKLGLLESCQIRAVRGYMPDGVTFDIYSDQGGFGNDLFVEIDHLEEARELIKEQAED